MATPAAGEPRDWHTVTSLRASDGEDGQAVWETAEHIADSLLADLVEVARESIIAFAPALPEDYPLEKCPASYRLAHLMQIRNLWNAVETDNDGEFGGGDYVIRPVPLDWMVKQILRPKRAVPVAL